MTRLRSPKTVLVGLAAVGMLVGGVGLASAAPGSKYGAAKRAAKKFDGRRTPDKRARALPAAPRVQKRPAAPRAKAPLPTKRTKTPVVHKVSPKNAATSKLSLQGGAVKTWHHGGAYMRNGVGWIALTFDKVAGKHVTATCHVNSPKGPATMTIKRDGSVVTKPLAQGVQDVSINVPNAPETFLVELKVAPIDGLTSADTGWLLYYCEMDPL